MLENLKRQRHKGANGDKAEERHSALLIQVGRIEEKLDNISNKMSFEHNSIREDTSYAAGALRDMSPTLVELETLKRDLLGRVSGLGGPGAGPVFSARQRRADRVADGIVDALKDGEERSVTDVTSLLRAGFPEYGDNSLRVVVSRKLKGLAETGRVESREVKNRHLYCRKV